MRALKVFTLGLFIILMFTSCGEEPTQQELLNATWEISELSYFGEALTQTPTGNIKREFVGVGKNFNTSFELSDNINYASSGTYKVDLTTTLNGTTDTQEILVNDFIGTGIYSINTGVEPTSIYFTSTQGENTNGTIDLLTDDRLEMTLNTTVTASDGTNIITTFLQQAVTLTR